MDVALLPNVFVRGEWEYIAFAPVGGIRSNINTGRVGLGVKFYDRRQIRRAAFGSRSAVRIPFSHIAGVDRAAVVAYVRQWDTPPQRGAPIWKDRDMTAMKPGVRPAVPHFSSGPCAKRPGWSLQALTDAVLGRSHRSKIGKAKLKRAIDLTREVLEVPADYRIGIVPASDTGAVEMALWSLLGRAARDHAGLGILRRRLGQRCRQGAQAQGRHRPEGALWRIARSVQDRFCHRRGVHLERHHLRRARAERRLDRRRPRRPHHLRRHLGGVRARARLAQARCRHLLLAEGARRRSRARHAHSLARARWSGWRATSRPGRCRRFSA